MYYVLQVADGAPSTNAGWTQEERDADIYIICVPCTVAAEQRRGRVCSHVVRAAANQFSAKLPLPFRYNQIPPPPPKIKEEEVHSTTRFFTKHTHHPNRVHWTITLAKNHFAHRVQRKRVLLLCKSGCMIHTYSVHEESERRRWWQEVSQRTNRRQPNYMYLIHDSTDVANQ